MPILPETGRSGGMARASTNPPAELVEREVADLDAADLETDTLLPFIREREDDEADLALRVRVPLVFLERLGRPLKRFEPLRRLDRLRHLPSPPVFSTLDRLACAEASEAADLPDLAVLPVRCSSSEGLVRPDRAVRAAFAARTALVLDEAPLEALRLLPFFTAHPVQPACRE